MIKRLRAACSALALALTLPLLSCAASSYTVVYYETADRRDAALSFEMEDVKGLSEVISYGAADGKLGETVYAAPESEGSDELTATLAFRTAEADYAEKFSENTGAPGISEFPSESAVKSERLGSYTVTYYVSGNAAAAVWADGSFAYSAVFTLADKSAVAAPEDVYPYVLAVIAS